MKLRLYFVLCFFFLGMMAAVRGNETPELKQPPKLLNTVNPVYPAEAKEKGIQGVVILEALINEKGDVAELKALTDKDSIAKLLGDKEPIPEPADPALIQAAIDAVKQWKYEPYRNASGKIESVRFSVTIRFKLK